MTDYILAWLRLTIDRRAVTALEYGLIGGVIVATIMLGFHVLASAESSRFAAIGTSL
jgi:Flp pilus assembly pilin Flp